MGILSHVIRAELTFSNFQFHKELCAEVLAVDTLSHVIRAELTLSNFQYHKELCAEVTGSGHLPSCHPCRTILL